MDVLNNDEQRVILRSLRRRARVRHRTDGGARPRSMVGGDLPDAVDLRDEAGQCRASGLSRSQMDCRALAEKKSAQDLDEWSERHARGLGLEAVTANHQRSERARHRSQLGDKAGLANSRFAPEKNQARLPPLRRIQPCLELGTLGDPADEERVEMRRTTGPIMVQYNLRFNGVRSTSHGPNTECSWGKVDVSGRTSEGPAPSASHMTFAQPPALGSEMFSLGANRRP